jgi:ferric-dicitrate binding protein FerR (iron transport regulator)
MKPDPSKLPLPPQVEAWLGEQSDTDRRALEETWRLAEHGRPRMFSPDQGRKQEVWATVAGSSRRAGPGRPPRARRRRAGSRSWRWTAAAIGLALLIGIGYVLRPITVRAPHGHFAEATLPDGSNVHLNSGSTLTYRAGFFGTRSVSLDGEAFFDVVPDEDAFVVETFNARTTVLGTQFNVRARSDEGTPVTTVVVASGRVQVASRKGLEAVLLTSGEQSIVRASSMPSPPSTIVVARELAWRHGGLFFSDEPFRVIFAEIERRFDVEIEAPLDVRMQPFAIYLQDPSSAEDVLANLTQAEGLRFRETANGFEVYRP